MNIVIMTNRKAQAKRVYPEHIIEQLRSYGNVSECITRREFDSNVEVLKNADFIFSTWGMPKLSESEIKQYLPNLKCVFYSAGTVQYFAKPFLNLGIKVFSSASANGVPVAEYTFAQIVLATKNYFGSARNYKMMLPLSALLGQSSVGNYKTKVGLVGLGAIGSMVAEKLKSIDVEVLAYDPFISSDKADALGVRLVDIKTLFSECQVISNHLANKAELVNFFNKDLFKLMGKTATFINTGRGKQVCERHLACAMLKCPRRTAVLDVQRQEITPFFSPLFWCHNIIMTPHIAGSTGGEVVRMAVYQIEEFERYLNGEQLKYEVTIESLPFMA